MRYDGREYTVKVTEKNTKNGVLILSDYDINQNLKMGWYAFGPHGENYGSDADRGYSISEDGEEVLISEKAIEAGLTKLGYSENGNRIEIDLVFAEGSVKNFINVSCSAGLVKVTASKSFSIFGKKFKIESSAGISIPPLSLSVK